MTGDRMKKQCPIKYLPHDRVACPFCTPKVRRMGIPMTIADLDALDWAVTDSAGPG